jgi:hypothetical protein
MGACDFVQEGIGKDAKDAFWKAQDEAAYLYGHGGYSGSLAEKGDFVDLTTIVTRYAKDNGYKYPQDRTITQIVYAALGGLDEWSKKRLNSKWHNLAKTIGQYVDDKWGPAGMIELRGSRSKELKRGTRGKTAYVIFGWASS